MGYYRIGCVLCPVASPKAKHKALSVSPRFEYAYKKAIKKCIEYGNYDTFTDENDVFNWWMSGKSVKKYLAMKKQGNLDM
jgi:phosphoadenosine phosphosulfate reductase